MRRLIVLASVLVLASAPAVAQAPPNLASARVRYNSLKNSTKPSGELKVQIDAIDKEIADASRLGQTSQVRRLLAKGMALLQGRGWTEADDYDQSLVLRTERVFVDSSLPYVVRLEQVLAPAIQLTGPLAARASVRPLTAQSAGSPEARLLKEFADVSRDLRDSPLSIELDLVRSPTVRTRSTSRCSTARSLSARRAFASRCRRGSTLASRPSKRSLALLRMPSAPTFAIRETSRGASTVVRWSSARSISRASSAPPNRSLRPQ
jgi:hypothetical protein